MDKTFFPAKLSQETPPSVIHGWKATDLLLMMVKRKIYFQNPISRQNFANAFAETPNLNLEVRHKAILAIYGYFGLIWPSGCPKKRVFKMQLSWQILGP